MNLCRSCGEDFASVAAFDGHRVGVHTYTFMQGLLLDPPVEDGRRCMGPEELTAAGMAPDSHGRFSILADAERIRGAFSGVRSPTERLADVELGGLGLSGRCAASVAINAARAAAEFECHRLGRLGPESNRRGVHHTGFLGIGAVVGERTPDWAGASE